MNKFLRSLTHRFCLLLIFAVSFSLNLSAQQGHIYNQFFMNPYIYNPAYAGVDGHGVVFVMYKQQWTSIGDGPSLTHATFHKPLKGGIGFGVMAFNETQGPLSTSAGKVSGSYLVNIDRKHFLRFGMSLGMGTNKLTLPEDAIGDPAFQGNSSNYIIGDFGATYHFNHFNVGFSLPNLFTSELIANGGFSDFQINPVERMLFKMNYRGHINHEIAIEPHILYRYSNVLPSQLEVATIVHLMHVAWVGGTFRQNAGFIALVGAKVKHKFAVGAAFELGNSNYNSLTGPTFELHVGMHMGGHKEKKLSHVEHHKTWFDTESADMLKKKADKDAAKLAAEQAALDNDNLTIVQNPTPVVIPGKKSNAWIISGNNLGREGEKGEQEIAYGISPAKADGASWAISPNTRNFEERDRTDGRREVAIKWVRISNGVLEESIVWTLIGEPDPSIQNEVKSDPIIDKKLDPVIDKPVVPIDKPVVNVPVDTRTYEELAVSNTALEVRRGNNILELPAGNYLIGGVYDDFDEAEKRSDEMFHKGFRDVRVGYVSARKHYYVILRSYPSIERASQDKSRMQSSTGLKDVWVLKVND